MLACILKLLCLRRLSCLHTAHIDFEQKEPDNALSGYQRVHIFGTSGRIEIEIPFNAPPDKPCKMWYQHGGGIEEILIPTTDQYMVQGELMSVAIINEKDWNGNQTQNARADAD